MIKLFCFLLRNSVSNGQATSINLHIQKQRCQGESVQELCQFVLLYSTVFLSLRFPALILPYDRIIFLQPRIQVSYRASSVKWLLLHRASSFCTLSGIASYILTRCVLLSHLVHRMICTLHLCYLYQLIF